MKSFLKWLGIGLVLLLVILLILLAINEILPPDWKMDADIFIVLASAVLSFMFMLFPKLRVAFAGLASEVKLYVNIVLVVLLAVFMFIGTCINFLPIAGIVCTVPGLKQLLIWIFLSIGGNQLAYKITSEPVDVREAKSERAAG